MLAFLTNQAIESKVECGTLKSHGMTFKANHYYI